MSDEKYLSIITNFGCHGKCPYCIVRKNGIDVPPTTTDHFAELEKAIKDNGITIVSVSGGGDPLHNYDTNMQLPFYYGALAAVLSKAGVPLEMHTTYLNTAFPYGMCKRVVYHLNELDELPRVKRHGDEIVRVVYVATPTLSERDILDIRDFAHDSPEIDELSFRQMVGDNYKKCFYNHDLLCRGHERGWWYYIQQCDYNLYFAEGKIYTRFADIGK